MSQPPATPAITGDELKELRLKYFIGSGTMARRINVWLMERKILGTPALIGEDIFDYEYNRRVPTADLIEAWKACSYPL